MSKTIPRPLIQANRSFLVLTITAALLISRWLLLIPLSVGLTALLTRKHLVMHLGKYFLKKEKAAYHLEDAGDARFNLWISTVCLSISGISFLTGVTVAGYIFSVMVILAAGIALMGFCVGCYLHFQFKQWKYRYEQNRSREGESTV